MITSDAGEECRIRSRVPMVAEYHLSITRVQQHHALLSVLRHATETEYCLSTPDFLLLDKSTATVTQIHVRMGVYVMRRVTDSGVNAQKVTEAALLVTSTTKTCMLQSLHGYYSNPVL